MAIEPEFLARVKHFNTKMIGAISEVKNSCIDDDDHKAFQGALLLMGLPVVEKAKKDDKELYKFIENQVTQKLRGDFYG